MTVTGSAIVDGQTLNATAALDLGEVVPVHGFTSDSGRHGIILPAGYTGKGVDRTWVTLVPDSMTAAQAALIPTAPGTTNPLYVAHSVDGRTSGPTTIGGFTLVGTPQSRGGYNGIETYYHTGSTFHDIRIIGVVDGFAGSPPGELFGLADQHGNGNIYRNIEVDGRDASGARAGASGIACNYSTNITWDHVYVHDHAHGMPTCYATNGITSYNLRSYGNGLILNHEVVGGQIRHYDLEGDSIGMHLTLENDKFDAPDAEYHMKYWTGGHYAPIGTVGPLCFMISDQYNRQRNADGTVTYVQKQQTLPKIYAPDGSLMYWADAGSAGDPKNGLAATAAHGISQAKADPTHWVVRFH